MDEFNFKIMLVSFLFKKGYGEGEKSYKGKWQIPLKGVQNPLCHLCALKTWHLDDASKGKGNKMSGNETNS